MRQMAKKATSKHVTEPAVEHLRETPIDALVSDLEARIVRLEKVFERQLAKHDA